MRSRLPVILVVGALLAGCGSDEAATTTTAAPPTTRASITTTAASVTTTAAPTTTSTTLEGALTWARADREGALARPGRQMILSVVAGGPGLVAVGSEESDGDADAAVWASADGYTWTQALDEADALGGAGIQMMYSVAVVGPGLVAVGVDDPEGSPEEGFVDTDAAVWVSADGYTWTRVPHDEALLGGTGDQRMKDVTTAGPGLVAIGSDYQDGSWPDGAVWVSADGYSWTRVDDPAVFGGRGGQELLSVTAGGPGVVAVGSGESYSNAAVWVSEDGHSWSRIPHDAAVFGGGSEMSSVLAAGPRLVAVGGSTSGKDEVRVWVSADGYTWTPIEDDADLSGPAGLSVNAAALWQGGLAMVGKDESSDQTGVVFWLSADGHDWDRISSDQAVFGDADDLEIAALTGWGTGLVFLAGDLSSSDWDGRVWVTPPPG